LEIPVTEVRKHQQSCQSASSNKNLSEEERAKERENGIGKYLVSGENLSQMETAEKERKSYCQASHGNILLLMSPPMVGGSPL